MPSGLEDKQVRELIRLAVREDLGNGDVTTEALVRKDTRAKAMLVARAVGVVAGLPLVATVLREFGCRAKVQLRAADGEEVKPGQVLAVIKGRARGILSAERTVLNFVQRLSGVATLTRRFVDAVTGTGARIYDTRKTTPGWRILEKYAVRVGGGENHRMGLYDQALIKDNHLALMKARGESLAEHVARLRASHPGILVEVEAEGEAGVREALDAACDVILLDNMTPAQLVPAVKLVRGAGGKTIPLLEASGGVDLANVRAIAKSGVDRISVGALTHSAPALDVAMDFER